MSIFSNLYFLMNNMEKMMNHPKVSYFDASHEWNGGKDIKICGFALNETMPREIIQHGQKADWPWLFVFFDGAARLNPGTPEETDCSESLMIWQPGTSHCYGSVNEKYRHSWLIVDFPEMDFLLKTWNIPIGKPIKINAGRIFSKYLPLFMEELASPNGDTFYLSSILRLFLYDLHRLYKQKMVVIPQRLLEIVMFMEEHLQEDISAGDIAKHFGTSIPHFNALFRQHYHCPPMKYLNKLRMIKASRLLICYPSSCKEIADLCGFQDPLYFSRCFHQYWGMSPLEFRRKRKFQPG